LFNLNEGIDHMFLQRMHFLCPSPSCVWNRLVTCFLAGWNRWLCCFFITCSLSVSV